MTPSRLRRNAALAASALGGSVSAPFEVHAVPAAPKTNPKKTPLAIPVGAPRQDLRGSVLQEIRQSQDYRRQLAVDGRLEPKGSSARGQYYRMQAQALSSEMHLQADHDANFVPIHAPGQLLGPQFVLMSSVFNVRSKAAPRSPSAGVTLQTATDAVTFRGPELRQVDGLVFLVIVNMLRDFRVGRLASFKPAEVCELVMGGHSGQSRNQLRETILRLQQSVLVFPSFSVQLVQRFEFPSSGEWSVALDPQIVELFKNSRPVWLDLDAALLLPTGLATWLYGYIESQSKLIPTSLDALRELSGSDAQGENFERALRRTLAQLALLGIIETKWKLKRGKVHWQKVTSNTGALVETGP